MREAALGVRRAVTLESSIPARKYLQNDLRTGKESMAGGRINHAASSTMAQP